MESDLLPGIALWVGPSGPTIVSKMGEGFHAYAIFPGDMEKYLVDENIGIHCLL